MLGFEYVNKNPKDKKTGDCSTRALANILKISWEEALKLLYEEALITKIDLADRKNMEKVLEKHGYVKIKQPRKFTGKKYLICEMDEVLSKEDMRNGVVVNCAHHYTIVRDGYIEDTWCCGNKSAGCYYAKKR